MRKVRWMFGAVALLASCGLVTLVASNGRSLAEEKKAEAAPKVTEEAKAVDEMATINGLMDYGYQREQPQALLLAAKMLLAVKVEPGEKLEVEGAGKGEVPDRKAQVERLIKDAAKMPTAKSASAKALAAEVADDLKAAPRGTPGKGTSWKGIVDPTNKTTDSPKAVLTRKFIGGQIAKVTVCKLFNAGVPLDVRVYDPAGNKIKHELGNSLAFDWLPKVDGNYRIEIRNYHTVGVLVQVNTN